jgi:calcineurin-like phosphoesterase
MAGPVNGILGVTPEPVILRNRLHMPQRFTVADGPNRARGALFDIDPGSGKTRTATAIEF